jgi:hypothetical protein
MAGNLAKSTLARSVEFERRDRLLDRDAIAKVHLVFLAMDSLERCIARILQGRRECRNRTPVWRTSRGSADLRCRVWLRAVIKVRGL